MTASSPSKSTYEILMEQIADADTTRDHELARIRRMIAMFERIYNMSSEEMSGKVSAGEMDETDDICQWQFYIDVISNVSQA